MGYVIDCSDDVLDEFGLEILFDIKKRASEKTPCLFDLLNNPCIKTAIAVYNKILELENNDYLNLRVDVTDCRIQYVHIGRRGEEVISSMNRDNLI